MSRPRPARREQDEVPEDIVPVVNLGASLRKVRLGSGLSLREVARRLGVSPSFVSQLESGKSQPSVVTLYALAQLLDISIDALFSGDLAAGAGDRLAAAPPDRDGTARDGHRHGATAAGPSPDMPVSRSALGSPANAWRPRTTPPLRLSVTKPGERPRLVMDGGVIWEQLAANTGPDLDFIEVNYPPHSSSTNSDLMLRHSGYEYGYLLEGELEVTVGFEAFTLYAGEALGFDSSTPHRFRNQGPKRARGIWCVRHTHSE